MNKIENDIHSSRKEDKQNTRSDSVLRWLKKEKSLIYVLNGLGSKFLDVH
jgi:hypothetical protein